jgi:hypothetical protein
MNFRKSSGHGIFMKGAVETLLKHGHYVDVVCDGVPEDNYLESLKINVYSPKTTRLSYTAHTTLFQFEDSFNFEKCINYREAITLALTNHVYDLVICNDLESSMVCHQMQLYERMRITSYAHECATINPELKEGVFKDCYYELIDKMMLWNDVTTLIQTEQNKQKLESRYQGKQLNVYVQPYPLTDSTPVHSLNKDGIIFIGRHEDRKSPLEFVRVLKEIRDEYGVEIKAKVMTRTAHIKKFEANFADIGYTNFEIKADIVGTEKAEFIQSAKLAFLPYKNESFGIAVLECLRFMPTVVVNKYDWHYNFHGMSNLIQTDLKSAAATVWNAYNTHQHDEQRVELEFEEYNRVYESALLNLVKDTPKLTAQQEPRNRLYQKMKQQVGTAIQLEEFFRTENTKGVIYLTSDIEAIYNNANWYQVLHTNSDTYIGIPDEKGNLQIPEKSSNEYLSNFFE